HLTNHPPPPKKRKRKIISTILLAFTRDEKLKENDERWRWRTSQPIGIYRVLGIRVDLCERSFSVRSAMIHWADLVVNSSSGKAKREGDWCVMVWCGLETEGVERMGVRASVVGMFGRVVRSGDGRDTALCMGNSREPVLLVFVAHAYWLRQSGELLAKFNGPEGYRSTSGYKGLSPNTQATNSPTLSL
ncbi:hypothetical protein V1477_009317, partial [Vespula maculifrons]